jgi:hypothetical protein
MLKYTDVPDKINEAFEYHRTNDILLIENIFRYGSEMYFEIINHARQLYENNEYKPMHKWDEDLLKSDFGKIGFYENKIVILDFPMINEAEYQGKKVELDKPKRGGSKKYYVYVNNPKTGKVIKVEFGAKSGGQNLSVKINDPDARKNFAARHDCDNKDDKTKPGYWSCRLPRFAKSLGLNGGGNYWW